MVNTVSNNMRDKPQKEGIGRNRPPTRRHFVSPEQNKTPEEPGRVLLYPAEYSCERFTELEYAVIKEKIGFGYTI